MSLSNRLCRKWQGQLLEHKAPRDSQTRRNPSKEKGSNTRQSLKTRSSPQPTPMGSITTIENISAVEEDIRQLDMDEATADEQVNETPSQSLLSTPSPSNSRWNADKERRRCELIEEVKTRLDRYSKRLLQEKEIQQLPRISRQEHYNLFTNARDGQKLSQAERQFLLEPDDFITTKMERSTRPFEWLIFDRYRNPWWHRVLIRLINTRPLEGSTYPSHIRSRLLKILITITVMALALALLLSPIIVLYLVPMRKAASAGVVVAFGFLFTLAMAIVPGIALDSIFIGLSAYMAVLVTFLANLQGN
ncbi:hypothetical protein B0T22DRAFT_442020 [Podospora appendiculata]|uniref:DUF6594 domain-containing protein n=1 Tax=Podospora appendiculata TaxID=314037 RepID=A0AAE1C9P3_9PEZI|nr:hypothetical protein B0T22DRAFT_442020 [Podospora appendiculata]